MRLVKLRFVFPGILTGFMAFGKGLPLAAAIAGLLTAMTRCASSSADFAGHDSLRVVTINVWSGLDYRGTVRFGEYETMDRREKRFDLLVSGLRRLAPDVVFIQEANPVDRFSSRLADSLGFDEVHQVCNAGVKFAALGIPSNFKEGIAILARKGLRLRSYAVWKLSGSFGVYGDLITVHFDESEFAQAATIEIGGNKMLLVNVHLSAYPPADSVVAGQLERWLAESAIQREELEDLGKKLSYGSMRRRNEIEKLMKNFACLPADLPVILAGDFNSEIASGEMRALLNEGGFSDTFSDPPLTGSFTWDAGRNENVAYSANFAGASRNALDLSDRIGAVYDAKPRRIDYVLLGRGPSVAKVLRSGIGLDSAVDGIHASDHYASFADIDIHAPSEHERASGSGEGRSKIEPLPIVSYDTDIGLGYGAKLFLFDLLHSKESLDIVLFNSTKGERWYRGVFSYPDIEYREGTVYPFAVDFTFDYDKWLQNNFYGIGNGSRFSDRESYTREPVEIGLTFSRGMTREFVGQIAVKYRSIENYGFDSLSILKSLPPSLNSATVMYASLGANIRYDTRNSFINPTSGAALQVESEYAPRGMIGNVSFLRMAVWTQYYYTLFYPPTVFALRVGLQQVAGGDLPVQVLTSLGGNNTLRGVTQDRFLDKAMALMNAEVRFPIVWRIGGVVGLDAGKVWQNLLEADLRNWAANPVAGLRLYMDNFVVRADLGFGRDGTGFYFNFGQVF